MILIEQSNLYESYDIKLKGGFYQCLRKNIINRSSGIGFAL